MSESESQFEKSEIARTYTPEGFQPLPDGLIRIRDGGGERGPKRRRKKVVKTAQSGSGSGPSGPRWAATGQRRNPIKPVEPTRTGRADFPHWGMATRGDSSQEKFQRPADAGMAPQDPLHGLDADRIAVIEVLPTAAEIDRGAAALAKDPADVHGCPYSLALQRLLRTDGPEDRIAVGELDFHLHAGFRTLRWRLPAQAADWLNRLGDLCRITGGAGSGREALAALTSDPEPFWIACPAELAKRQKLAKRR